MCVCDGYAMGSSYADDVCLIAEAGEELTKRIKC